MACQTTDGVTDAIGPEEADAKRSLLLFPSQVLAWSGSADPELTVSAFSSVENGHSDKMTSPLREGECM